VNGDVTGSVDRGLAGAGPLPSDWAGVRFRVIRDHDKLRGLGGGVELDSTLSMGHLTGVLHAQSRAREIGQPSAARDLMTTLFRPVGPERLGDQPASAAMRANRVTAEVAICSTGR